MMDDHHQQQQQQPTSNLVVIVPLGPAAQSVAEALRHVIFCCDVWETKYYRAPLTVLVDHQSCNAEITLYVHVGDSQLPINGEVSLTSVQVLLNFTDIPLLLHPAAQQDTHSVEEIVFGCRALVDLNENWRHACEAHPPLLTQEGMFSEDPFRRLKTIIDTASWSYSEPLRKCLKTKDYGSDGGSDRATVTSVLEEFEPLSGEAEIHSLMDDIAQLRSQALAKSISDEERRTRAEKLILRLSEATGLGCDD